MLLPGKGLALTSGGVPGRPTAMPPMGTYRRDKALSHEPARGACMMTGQVQKWACPAPSQAGTHAIYPKGRC